ncbi:MAG: transglycosylase domain-containing protein [Lachnospiraceae bacterium]|nr:transglycosylase domain-containing protein [Lachnospiraceae bacterium]
MNFGYSKTTEKRKKLSSKKSKRITGFFIGCFKFSLYCIVLFIVVIGFTGLGMIKGIIKNAPDIDTLSVTPTGYSTTVYDSDGNVMTTLLKSGSNRQEISINEIPLCLQYAFIDIEDERFLEHNGIDLKGIIRAGVVAITTRNFSEGASTITQQLLKNTVFENGGQETSLGALFKRKFQEQYLALELEKTATKDYILQNYLNTINLGSNCLGVQSAAKRYFNKNASELNISESAVIAAITQNPSRYNPVTNPEENAKRREKVLKNMYKNGHITKAEYDEALADDVYSRIQSINLDTSTTSPYSYFVDELVEQIINDLQEQKGYTQTQAYNVLYSGGLTIYTTQDTTIQNICDEEVNNPDNYPLAVKYSVNWAWSVKKADGTVQNYSEVDLEYYNRVLLEKSDFKLIFSSTEECDALIQEFKQEYLKEGEEELDENIEYTLQPQTSFTVIDQHTGYVKAIVGGRGEKTGSRTLNRATNTKRQPGSCFKVLSTYAPAIDTAGYTLASTIEDAPFADVNGRPVSNWWGDSYRGLSTLREGIYDSMNVVTAKLITAITPQLGFDYLQEFGFTTLVEKETLADGSVVSDIGQALSLGGITYGVKNIELCAAYAAIANSGVYIEPIYYTKVLDHNGKVILESTPSTHTVLKESTAWLLTNAMEDVVKIGTGTACRVEGMSVAGKTGTTTNDNDIWFSGYTPYLTATIWCGYDENAKLSNTVYHEQMWSKIMTRINDAKGYTEDIGFPMPDSIISAQVCKTSGNLAISGSCPVVNEYFAKGTVPKAMCNIHLTTTPPADASATTPTDGATQTPDSSADTAAGTVTDNTGGTGTEASASP